MSLPVTDAPDYKYDPSFQTLRQLLVSGSGIQAIEAEVRRLCLIALTIGTERGIAWILQTADKSDEAMAVETDK